MRNVEFDIEEGALIASLSGEIDHYAAADMRREIDSAMERSRLKDLVLDYSGVSFMDSSGIGLVMGRYQNVKRKNGTMVVVPGQPVRQPRTRTFRNIQHGPQKQDARPCDRVYIRKGR